MQKRAEHIYSTVLGDPSGNGRSWKRRSARIEFNQALEASKRPKKESRRRRPPISALCRPFVIVLGSARWAELRCTAQRWLWFAEGRSPLFMLPLAMARNQTTKIVVETVLHNISCWGSTLIGPGDVWDLEDDDD